MFPDGVDESVLKRFGRKEAIWAANHKYDV